jgi:hypothetical protein
MLLPDERLEIARPPGSGKCLMWLGLGIDGKIGGGHRDGHDGCRRWINRKSSA